MDSAALCLPAPPPAGTMAGMSPVPPRLTPSPIRALLARLREPGMLSFAGGLPDPALFPGASLAEAAAAALRDGGCLQYAPSEGDPALRAWVAGRLRRRGVAAEPDQVLITNGSQHALQVAARLLAGPGAAIALDAPAYPGARQAAELAGARTVDLALDAGGPGWDPGRLARAHRRRPLAALITMPTGRNPTGATLSVAARQELAAALARCALPAVEDDAYAELWYDQEPPPALAAYHPATVLTGSFSKILAPGLRLGWLRVPPALAGDAAVLLQATCLHANGLAQATLLRWLAVNDLDAHLARVRACYRARRDHLLAALHAQGLPCPRPPAGMFCWLPLPAGLAGAAAAAAALAARVAVVAGGAFHAGGRPDRHLRLCFATLPPAQLDQGVERLAAALAGLRAEGVSHGR